MKADSWKDEVDVEGERQRSGEKKKHVITETFPASNDTLKLKNTSNKTNTPSHFQIFST